MIDNDFVSIILVNYNGAQDTVECINSIFRSNYNKFRVFVVDNASTDNSLRTILDFLNKFKGSDKKNDYLHISKQEVSSNIDTKETDHKKIILIENDSNSGFAAGNNIAIEFATKINTDVIWLLNNDTIIDPDAISYNLEKINSNRKSIVGSLIYYYGQQKKIQAWGGGVIDFWKGNTHHLTDKGVLDYITGASLCFPAELINLIGYLDEGFFMYWEDTDFCFRAKKAGYKLCVAEKAIIYHKHNVSLKREDDSDNSFRDSHSAKGVVRFFLKNYRLIGVIPVIYRVFQGIFRRISGKRKTSFFLMFNQTIKSIIGMKK